MLEPLVDDPSITTPERLHARLHHAPSRQAGRQAKRKADMYLHISAILTYAGAVWSTYPHLPRRSKRREGQTQDTYIPAQVPAPTTRSGLLVASSAALVTSSLSNFACKP